MKKVILIAISAYLSIAVFAQNDKPNQTKDEKNPSLNKASAANKKEGPGATAFNKELLLAFWKDGKEEYTFNKNGTSQVKIDNRTCPGTWILENKTLTIKPKKLMWKKSDPCGTTKVLEVISLSRGSLHVIDTKEKKELHLRKEE